MTGQNTLVLNNLMFERKRILISEFFLRMKLGIHRRDISTSSVANVLQVLCQTVQWMCPNLKLHKDIIEFPFIACWQQWMAANGSEKSFERPPEELSTLFLGVESCLNAFYRMARYAEFECERAKVRGDDTTGGALGESSYLADSSDVEVEDPAVLPSGRSQLGNSYCRAVQKALKAMGRAQPPWTKVLGGSCPINSVSVDFAYPLRWTFTQERTKGRINDVFDICPGLKTLKTVHWLNHLGDDEDSLQHIIDGENGIVTKIRAVVPRYNDELTFFDIPSAFVIAHEKIADDNRSPSTRHQARLFQDFAIEFGHVMQPLSSILDPSGYWGLWHPLPLATSMIDNYTDLKIYFRDIEPNTFNSKLRDIEETMPKKIFNYEDKYLIDSEIPDLRTYAVDFPKNIRRIDPMNLQQSDCNCVFASINNKLGEKVDVAVYQREEELLPPGEQKCLSIFFPTRKYVFEIRGQDLAKLNEPGQSQKLKQVMVYLEEQCPPGVQYDKPWVKVSIDFQKSRAEYDLKVERPNLQTFFPQCRFNPPSPTQSGSNR